MATDTANAYKATRNWENLQRATFVNRAVWDPKDAACD